MTLWWGMWRLIAAVVLFRPSGRNISHLIHSKSGCEKVVAFRMRAIHSILLSDLPFAQPCPPAVTTVVVDSAKLAGLSRLPKGDESNEPKPRPVTVSGKEKG
jgi:hypothetical protein